MTKKQVIGWADSAIKARRMLDQIAIAGGYKVTGAAGNFPIYSRQVDGVNDEISIEKTKKRRFDVIKLTRKLSTE